MEMEIVIRVEKEREEEAIASRFEHEKGRVRERGEGGRGEGGEGGRERGGREKEREFHTGFGCGDSIAHRRGCSFVFCIAVEG